MEAPPRELWPESDATLSDEANKFIKKGKQALLEKFVVPARCVPTEKPLSIFMAGSPGAGKTEVSRNLVDALREEGVNMMRIDPDEIRSILPQYNGANSYLFQRAVSTGVNKLLGHALNCGLHCILDGTFSKYENAQNNIDAALARGRIAAITYVYQNPLLAWGFTKKRERVEGRFVPKQAFIEQYFASRETVSRIKQAYGDRVSVDLIIKPYNDDSQWTTHFNTASIDSLIHEKYTKDELESLINEDT